MGHCLIPPTKNMATIQTHHTKTRAKSRSYSEPLSSLDPSFLSSSSSIFAAISPLATSLISPFLTSGAYTFLLTLAFLSLHEGISFSQSITHSFIPLVSDRWDPFLLEACQWWLSRSETLEGQIKSSFLFFLCATIALCFIGCLPLTLACERGTGY